MQQVTSNWKIFLNSTSNLGLKRRLGITQWREFSEDMTQVLTFLFDVCCTRSYSRVWRTSRRVPATRGQLRIFNLQRFVYLSLRGSADSTAFIVADICQDIHLIVNYCQDIQLIIWSGHWIKYLVRTLRERRARVSLQESLPLPPSRFSSIDNFAVFTNRIK